MPQIQWLELPVFIHGITPEEYPHSHNSEYDTLFHLVNKALARRGKTPFGPKTSIKVEWGWHSNQSQQNDRFLAKAERLIAKRARKATEEEWDWTLNPLRAIHLLLRRVILLGFADMFYYVSSDGERAVRTHVFNHLCKQIDVCHQKNTGKNISLTFITHSAGSVIAHDLLYHLFGRPNPSPIKPEVNKIRKLAKNSTLRIRKLYTMGSPFTPLIFRADSLLTKIKNRQELDPEAIGLRAADKLKNPRWVNFWDKDDVLSYPVQFLYKKVKPKKVVEDKYIDLGDIFPLVHVKYWKSEELADYIAETF